MSTTAAPTKVVVVEDNETLCAELVHFLTAAGIQALGLGDGLALTAHMAHDQPDVLILDLNLPFEDGIQIARRVRQAFPEVRIAMLTGRARGIDRTEGYEAGADVYLTKPTRPAELLAVVRNLHQRRSSAQAAVLRWTLDVTRRCLVSSQGHSLRLTEGETNLLQALALAGGGLDHEQLLGALGADAADARPGKARLEVLVSRLRSKLRGLGPDGLAIHALRGHGYQLGFALACSGPAAAVGGRGGVGLDS
ncbi:MAG: response regulator transcription factor [Aquabacterium sp.]|nr:response regulator transcription factor [Aquabacterium sp.]